MMRQSRIPLLCLYYFASTSSSSCASGFAARSSSVARVSSSLLGPRGGAQQQSSSTPPHGVSVGVDVSTRRAMASSPSDAASSRQDAGAGLTDIGRAGGGGGGAASSDADKPDESESSTSTTWREKIAVSIARSRKVRGGNFVQIATVDSATGEPRCRTVVFRGFLKPNDSDGGGGAAAEEGSTIMGGESTVMKMITDLRSSKVGEASGGHESGNKAGASNAEMVWWFGKSSEQYRVRGQLDFVGGGTFDMDGDEFYARARKEQWGNLSDTAREQFYWREPGVPYAAQATVPPGGRGEDGKVLPPPENFLLMLLCPTRVDYLRLTDNFRQVDECDGGRWQLERANP